MSEEQFTVNNNEAARRYEVNIDGQMAMLTYKRDGDQITFLHTGVPAPLGGKGIANRLASTALEEARMQHLIVIPMCPFVAAYIRRHPEYLSLLPASEQARLRQEATS